jgi:hypothetical protein
MLITSKIKEQFEKTAIALNVGHGIISLTFHIREGQVLRHTIGHKESFQHSEKRPTHNDSVLRRKVYTIKNPNRLER